MHFNDRRGEEKIERWRGKSAYALGSAHTSARIGDQFPRAQPNKSFNWRIAANAESTQGLDGENADRHQLWLTLPGLARSPASLRANVLREQAPIGWRIPVGNAEISSTGSCLNHANSTRRRQLGTIQSHVVDPKITVPIRHARRPYHPSFRLEGLRKLAHRRLAPMGTSEESASLGSS